MGFSTAEAEHCGDQNGGFEKSLPPFFCIFCSVFLNLRHGKRGGTFAQGSCGRAKGHDIMSAKKWLRHKIDISLSETIDFKVEKKYNVQVDFRIEVYFLKTRAE